MPLQALAFAGVPVLLMSILSRKELEYNLPENFESPVSLVLNWLFRFLFVTNPTRNILRM